MAPKKAKPSSAAAEVPGKEKGGAKDKSKAPIAPPAETKPPERPPGYIEMKPFQRLPKEILHNHCQKHKMPKPHYEQRKASKGFYKTECILANVKDASKTMRFLTNEEFPFKQHSENFSALLALHHLEPTRPYEKLFPSPFKEAWMALSGDLPHLQQQQEQQQQQGAAGIKKPSAKAKATKGLASPPAAAERKAAATHEAGQAPGDTAASEFAGKEAAKRAGEGAAAVESDGLSGEGALGRPAGGGRSPWGPSSVSEETSKATCGLLRAASPKAPSLPSVHISSAFKFASEFEKQQAAETRRIEKVKKEKEKELQRLEEEAQMPTVFMAESVRSKVASVLKEILPHVAAAAPDAGAAAAAVAAASKSAEGMSISKGLPLLPLQWVDAKWLAAISHALKRLISTPRAVGALKTRMLKQLAGPLQFQRDAASLAVEVCLAVLLRQQPQQHEPQQQSLQQETMALDQLLESCQDFVAINTTDEASLPPHFSPAGKQIEIRCQGVSTRQQQEQQLQEQQTADGNATSLETAKKHLRRLLQATKESPSAAATHVQLAEALWSLCCSTGLYAAATGALQQPQHQEQCEPCSEAAGFAGAFAAVANAALSVVIAGDEGQNQNALHQLADSGFLNNPAVLQRLEAIKQQELEAAESILQDSLSETLKPSSGAPAGFYLRVPIDVPTLSSIENSLKASLGIEHLKEGARDANPSAPLTLHILSPPGAHYPLEAPVVWISSEAFHGTAINADLASPYGDDIGAILCGAFAAHNATRLSQPLQQLCENCGSLGCSLRRPYEQQGPPDSLARVLTVLSSSACETSISDIAALLHASWQFEALLDELIANEPNGLRGMHGRWLAAATGSLRPPAAITAVATTASPAMATDAGPEKSQRVAKEKSICKVEPSGNQASRAGTRRSQKESRRFLEEEPEAMSPADIRLCKDIVESVKHPASAAAMSLPVRQHFDSIREFMGDPERQVLVVQGETGSGKTTQLPRMLLEAAAEATLLQQRRSKNRNVSSSSNTKEELPAYIVCTQPRRLAAVSVASRVATEMGVPVGSLVGYHVRLQSRSSPQTRLLFCTHGVLLRQILSDNALGRISVVVVDEVHERCTEVDILLLVLAKALASNKYKLRYRGGAECNAAGATVAGFLTPSQLKVVVMSASFSVDLFVAYFRPERLLSLRAPLVSGNRQHQQQQLWQQQQMLLREKGDAVNNTVMTLKVPGRTFPVSVLFLSEVLRLCDGASLPCSYQNAAATAAAIGGRYRGGRPSAAKTEWREEQGETFGTGGAPAGKLAAASSQAAAAAAAAAGAPVCALPQLPQLVAAIVRHIHLAGTHCVGAAGNSGRGPRWSKQRQQQQKQQHQSGTAIIVFCSGMGEVSAVCRAIEELRMDLWVLPCHASLHPSQQQKVFAPPPPGLRKVVVATNVAETSITIADVGYVVDCGTHKMLRYDAVKRSSKLQEEMITQANAQQRAGRAGRVTEGLCFRLYEREEFDSMQNTETPELHRQALDNVCLQLKAIFPEEPLHSLFSQCVEPPAQDHVDASIRLLIHLGALEASANGGAERLTSLGFYLSHFPMNIAFAKMLILAAPLGCLEETTALCALMGSESDLYVTGADAAAERNRKFARSQSDFVTNLKVFSAWESAVAAGRREEEAFCSKFGVNASSMQTAEELRTRFRRVVKDVGLAGLMGSEMKDGKSADKPKDPPRASVQLAPQEDEVGESDQEEEGVTLRVDEASPVVFRGSPGASSSAKEEDLRARRQDAVRKIFWHIKACVVGGLYPQVATIQAPRAYMTVGSGTLERTPEAWQMKFFTRVEKDPNVTDEEYLRQSAKQRLQRVFIHPTSVNFKTCDYDTQWVAYLEKIQTSKVFIKDVSTVSVFALLLLSCCEIGVSQGEGALWLDGWLQLREASPQRTPNYDILALEMKPKPMRFVFFGEAGAVDRRNKLTDLVKRLVELEGHLL